MVSSISLAPVLVFFIGIFSVAVIGLACRWKRKIILPIMGYSLVAQAVGLAWALSLFASFPIIVLMAVMVAGIGFLIELCGVRFGIPFGKYQYTDALKPQLLTVPVCICLAWWIFSVPSFAVATRITDHPLLQLLIAAQLVMAIDLFVDPIFVNLDCWRWERKGKFFGIPLINYGGWFLAALIILSCVRLFTLRFMPLFMLTQSTLIAIYAITITLHSLGMLFIWPWREWRILLFAVPLLYWPLVVLYFVKGF